MSMDNTCRKQLDDGLAVIRAVAAATEDDTLGAVLRNAANHIDWAVGAFERQIDTTRPGVDKLVELDSQRIDALNTIDEMREWHTSALNTIEELKAQLAEKDAQIAADNNEILALREKVAEAAPLNPKPERVWVVRTLDRYIQGVTRDEATARAYVAARASMETMETLELSSFRLEDLHQK